MAGHLQSATLCRSTAGRAGALGEGEEEQNSGALSKGQ
jgi:hypothetical protein